MTTVSRMASVKTAQNSGGPSRPPPDADLSSDEEFVDAVEYVDPGEGTSSGCPMSLSEALEQCAVALDRFLNNDLEGAMRIMRPWRETSLYHSLAMAIFEFIPAVLTLEAAQVARALAAIKQTLALCQRLRRSYSLVESLHTIIRKPDLSSLSELEAHAELCYAEALLLQAALALLDGEDLAGLLRATLRVNTSHNTYKSCSRILQQRAWANERSRRDFESGVRLGVGTFEYIVSLLPPRVVALLAFAGFTGNRAAGVAELQRGSQAAGLRAPLCDLTLLAAQLVVGHFVAAPPDMHLVTRILRDRLQQYPGGAFFLVFRGRLQLLRGRGGAARRCYERVAAVPRLWPQLTHLTYWECMWAASVELQWRDAAEFAARLLAESAWSRTVYAYARAAFLLQLRDARDAAEIDHLLRSAAGYRQRIAGKSLPMEKFVARRCERWAARRWLPLPALELLCLWNMFPAVAADRARALQVLQIIDEAYDEVRGQRSGGGECGRLPAAPETGAAGGPGGRRGRRARGAAGGAEPLADSEAVMLLLRGSMFAASGNYLDALNSLHVIFEMRNDIEEDTFVVPYAMFEMASCYLCRGERARGEALLRDIRRSWSGFLLEARLQFRVQARLAAAAEPPPHHPHHHHHHYDDDDVRPPPPPPPLDTPARAS